MTRKTKTVDLFTFRVLRRLLSGIRAGLTTDTAAHKAGIPLRQLKLTLAKGVEDLDNDPSTKDARLLLAIRQQEASCQLRWIGLLELAGSSRARVTSSFTRTVKGAIEAERGQSRMDSKAFMYLLERRFPREWGPVATATDMHTAAAVDLLRQGVTELKKARIAGEAGEQRALPAGALPLVTARDGVDVQAQALPVSFLDDDSSDGNALVSQRGDKQRHGTRTPTEDEQQ